MMQTHNDIEEDVPLADRPMGRIYALNKPEIGYLVVGLTCGFLVGCIWPIFSILFSNVIGVRVLCIHIYTECHIGDVRQNSAFWTVKPHVFFVKA